MNRGLWIAQGLLSALFLMAGGVKLALPLDEMVAQSGLPGPFIIFLGIVELLGAIGLVLPAALRIHPGLTPLAAAGLTVIMIGATALTALGVGGGDPVGALFPLAVGLLMTFVAYGRWQLSPTQPRQARARLAQAALA